MPDDDFDEFDDDKPKRQRAAPDPELQAMGTAARVIAPLDHDGQQRVVGYLADRFPDKPAMRPDAGTPLDGSAHADRAGRTFQAVKAQDGRPAVAEP